MAGRKKKKSTAKAKGPGNGGKGKNAKANAEDVVASHHDQAEEMVASDHNQADNVGETVELEEVRTVHGTLYRLPELFSSIIPSMMGRSYRRPPR